MKINKGQGKSLTVAGFKLDNDVFSHGQFHVGCSRVGKPESLFILAPEVQNGRDKNAVFQEAVIT